MRVNKDALAKKVQATCKVSATVAELAVQTVVDGIASTLAAKGEVYIPEIGKFEIVKVAARNGRNPKTGASVRIPAKNAVKLRPSDTMKRAVN